MKILICINRYMDSKMSSAQLINSLSDYFSSKNHQVSILTSNHSIKKNMIISDKEDNLIYQVKYFSFRSNSLLKRFIIEYTLPFKIWYSFKNNLIKEKYDLIVVYSPSIFWNFLISKIKKLNPNIKSFLILRDFFPKWLVDANILSKYSFIYFLLRFYEKSFYKKFDIIGLQSKSDLNQFLIENKKISNSIKVIHLNNWINIKRYKNKTHTNLREEGDKRFTIIYGGNIGYAQDINLIFKIVNSFKNHQNINFKIIGEGTEYQNLYDKLYNFKNVHISKSIPFEDYLECIKGSQLGLITLRKDLKQSHYPGKMLGYLLSEIPLCACINSNNEFIDYVNENKIGIAFNHKDIEKLISKIYFLYDNRQELLKLKKNTLNLLIKDFDVSMAYNKIINNI